MEWLQDPKLAILRDEIFQQACSHVNIIISKYSVPQMFDYIQNAKHVYFESFVSSVSDYYYTVDQSYTILMSLLKHQFVNEEEHIECFVNDLFNVLNRTSGKRNCLQIIGPPNSFKSTFARVVASAMINTGFCNKVNKYNVFALQEFVHRRLVIMDDPNFASDQLETFKTLFSGDPTNVQVKFQSDSIINKTPILLVANYNHFTGNVWDQRIHRYNWNTWDVYLEKQIHPMALYTLFNKYNLLYIVFNVLHPHHHNLNPLPLIPHLYLFCFSFLLFLNFYKLDDWH